MLTQRHYAQYWARQDAAAAAAKQGLQWLARIARQYVRHMDVDCATMRHSRGHVQCEEAARAWVDLAGRPAHTSVQGPSEVRSGVKARLPTAHALAAQLIETCLLLYFGAG